ncbi:MAG: MltA domain-containing protein [Methylobacteriaceae bacterium]|nr:MltA domain-containing protein [Methylobacteriaceae bacterium]
MFAAGAALPSPSRALPEPSSPPGDPIAFSTLPGWAADDHGAALAALRRTCRALADGKLPGPELVAPACAAAPSSPAEARSFFESWFEPRALPGDAFLTAYFEPELEASLTPGPDFPAPLFARPARLPDPAPDRAAIEAGALGEAARPIAYLRDAVAAFMVHVQGSARLRLPDGTAVRVGFDGRNGHPYTPIGRVLADRLGVPPAEMDAERVWAWLRANPAEAPAVMAANRSFIFFRRADELADAPGPRGAAGVPLTAGRSLAVDPSAWPYGLPIWLSGSLPDPAGSRVDLARLVVAQDAGAAIRGPSRGDLFLGSGEAAGRAAALVRETVRFVVLWPRATPAP